MPIDIIYLAFNRLEYTRKTTEALIVNTDWSMVGRLILYDDGSEDGTREYLESVRYPVVPEFVFQKIGGPVAIMRHYLSMPGSEIFAKIDNDTMVPEGWLRACIKVMKTHPALGLLGIEAFNSVQVGDVERSYSNANHIGGIGLMRRNCFRTLPSPNGFGGRHGFTQWQKSNKSVIKGWVNPSLPVCLLDKLPIEPWATLAREYIERGWQRSWPLYTDEFKSLWEWWN